MGRGIFSKDYWNSLTWDQMLRRLLVPTLAGGMLATGGFLGGVHIGKKMGVQEAAREQAVVVQTLEPESSKPPHGWELTIDDFLRFHILADHEAIINNSEQGKIHSYEVKPQDGTVGLDYWLVGCADNPLAHVAKNMVLYLPQDYVDLLIEANTKLLVMPDATYLPPSLRRKHDRNLKLYHEAMGTESLCGIRMLVDPEREKEREKEKPSPTGKTLDEVHKNRTSYAILFLHCPLIQDIAMHELGHAFDSAAGKKCLPKEPTTLLSYNVHGWRNLYCNLHWREGKKCEITEPNDVQQYTEEFAIRFAEFYRPGDSRLDMMKDAMDYYTYFKSLEQEIHQCVTDARAKEKASGNKQ